MAEPFFGKICAVRTEISDRTDLAGFCQYTMGWCWHGRPPVNPPQGARATHSPGLNRDRISSSTKFFLSRWFHCKIETNGRRLIDRIPTIAVVRMRAPDLIL